MRSNKIIGIIAIPFGVAIAIIGGIYGFQMFQDQFAKADDITPMDVTVTNVTDSSATIVWTTPQETQSIIEYGTSPNQLTFYAPELAPGRNHSVNITLLSPNTVYYFTIRSGDKTFDNAGLPWTFKTKPLGGGDSTNTTINPSPIANQNITPILSAQPLTNLNSAVIRISTYPTAGPVRLPTTQYNIQPSKTVVVKPVVLDTPTPSPLTNSNPICNSNDCDAIILLLGKDCKTDDYIRCRQASLSATSVSTIITTNTSPTPTLIPVTPKPTSVGVRIKPLVTPTPTVTPTPIYITQDNCKISFLQSIGGCRFWTWDSIQVKHQTCANAFFRYLLQCRTVPFPSPTPTGTLTPTETPYISQPPTSTPQPTPTGLWYCNNTIYNIASNSAEIPCLPIPPPSAGQTIYCQIRAEDAKNNYSGWVYGQGICQ